jgi:HAD superfamily phosphoserine phosphatase-like hydrolase
MSLSKITRDDKEYLYFKVNGSKRLYLGTRKEPKKERIEKALHFLTEKIRKYETQLEEIKKYLPERIEEHDIGYKIVAFDLDGVVFDKPWFDTVSEKTAVSTWDLLFQEVGHYKVHEDFKQSFIEGRFKSYMEWTEKACDFLKSIGLTRDTFEKVINQRPLVPGARELFNTLNNKQVITAVITGSFDALAQRAKKELGITYTFAHCKLNFNKNGLLKSWELKPTDYENKADFIKQIASENNISLKKECVYIGDDVNDIEAFKIVALSIAFNAPKIKVQKSVNVIIDSRNLESILPHLYVEKLTL